MSGLIWIKTVWHSDGIPERILRKDRFWKKNSKQKKAWIITQQVDVKQLTDGIKTTDELKGKEYRVTRQS